MACGEAVGGRCAAFGPVAEVGCGAGGSVAAGVQGASHRAGRSGEVLRARRPGTLQGRQRLARVGLGVRPAVSRSLFAEPGGGVLQRASPWNLGWFKPRNKELPPPAPKQTPVGVAFPWPLQTAAEFEVYAVPSCPECEDCCLQSLCCCNRAQLLIGSDVSCSGLCRKRRGPRGMGSSV